jgi:uncharacterized membrane protein YbhN (UPF0104 family)
MNASDALQAVESLRIWTFKYRQILFCLAATTFAVGVAWAVIALKIDPQELNYQTLCAVLSLSLMSILFNVTELQLCAQAIGSRLSFRSAAIFSTTATVANILPVPASVLLRGAALRSVGAEWSQAGGILLAASLMWLTMAVAISGYAITSGKSALAIVLTSSLGTALIVAWICQLSNLKIALAFMLVRVAMLGLLVLRLWFCFATLNVAVELSDVGAFALSGIIGNAFVIFPAGMGISEVLGALMAGFVQQSPEAAFLVLAINRIVGLGFSGFIALILTKK